MERNSYSSKTIVLMYLLLSILGCTYPKAKFGKEANANREKMGLEILPETWKAISVGDNYTVWKNPMGDILLKENMPLFFSKSSSYNEKNELLSEEDLYYSGNKFSSIDGHQRESVSIEYYFTPQKLGDNEAKGWHCTYIGPSIEADATNTKEEEKKYVSTPSVITLIKADSLLKKWGLVPPQRKTKASLSLVCLKTNVDK